MNAKYNIKSRSSRQHATSDEDTCGYCLDTAEHPSRKVPNRAAVKKQGLEPRTDLDPRRVIDHRPRSVTAPVHLDQQTQHHNRQRLVPNHARFFRPNPIGLLKDGSWGPADERPVALATLGGVVEVGIPAIGAKFHGWILWGVNTGMLQNPRIDLPAPRGEGLTGVATAQPGAIRAPRRHPGRRAASGCARDGAASAGLWPQFAGCVPGSRQNSGRLPPACARCHRRGRTAS